MVSRVPCQVRGCLVIPSPFQTHLFGIEISNDLIPKTCMYAILQRLNPGQLKQAWLRHSNHSVLRTHCCWYFEQSMSKEKRTLTDLSLVWTSCVWSRWNEPLVSYRWMHYNTAGNPDITKCPRGTGRVFVITWQEHPLSGFYPIHITVTGTIDIFQESLLCKGVFVMSTGFTLIFNLRCPF